MVTASVASSPGGLINLITTHLPASIFLGFLEAVSRPSPLSPQGLCICCAFHSDTCRAHSIFSEASAQMHYHPVPSAILPLKAATQHPLTPMYFLLTVLHFLSKQYHPVILRSVSVCLLSVCHFPLQVP